MKLESKSKIYEKEYTIQEKKQIFIHKYTYKFKKKNIECLQKHNIGHSYKYFRS